MLGVHAGRFKLAGSWTSAAIVVVVGLIALGVASRFVNVSRVDSGPTGGGAARTGDVLTVGVIANISGGGRAGADYVRGIRLWLSRVRDTNGIPYNANRHAAVRMVVRDDRGRPDQARNIASKLIREGASVIFGPPNPDELTGVADGVSATGGALLFSPIPRPSTVPETARATFLYRAPIGDLHAALDVVFARSPRGRSKSFTRRIVLLTEQGEWARRARAGQLLAQQRAFDAKVILVETGGINAALNEVRYPLDAIIAVAPFRRSLRWFANYRLKSTSPWILASSDLATALAPAHPYTVAVAVPWSPTSIGGDSTFPPSDFAATYKAVYGTVPSVNAAAGAALGALLNELVVVARSTDPSRLVRARETLKSGSLWGPLSFSRGEQAAFSPYVVLLDRGKPVSIWPPPGQVAALGLSIPPAAKG